ncbi:MAG TPA: uracil-DNA glycosylase, partial [Bacteroidota bacterium]|nr:uracil-DNA glycosylase [Bacteroidota bacterium]
MDILARVRQFLLDEKNLFGDTLMAEERPPAVEYVPSSPQPMTARRTVKENGGPSLFPEAVEPWQNARSLDELNAMICNCQKCELWETRKNFVFGVGNPRATFMIIGEAPGA